MESFRAIGNVLWLVLFGWWLAIGYVLAGIIMALPIITIPMSVQAFKLAGYVLWPFGRTMVERQDSDEPLALVGNVFWVVLVGWWLALAHLGAAMLLFVTIVGIPFAVVVARMAAMAVWPVGMEVVGVDEAERRRYEYRRHLRLVA